MGESSFKSRRRVSIFVSYSHTNAAWFSKLRPLLKFRAPIDLANAWHDHELVAGDRWDPEIRAELLRMDIFVCLISYEFLASDYIMNVEVKAALERQVSDGIVIVPIMLYDTDLKTECPELGGFNPLPEWGKCWLDYEKNGGHYQGAHKAIRGGLRAAINKVRRRTH